MTPQLEEADALAKAAELEIATKEHCGGVLAAESELTSKENELKAVVDGTEALQVGIDDAKAKEKSAVENKKYLDAAEFHKSANCQIIEMKVLRSQQAAVIEQVMTLHENVCLARVCLAREALLHHCDSKAVEKEGLMTDSTRRESHGGQVFLEQFQPKIRPSSPAAEASPGEIPMSLEEKDVTPLEATAVAHVVAATTALVEPSRGSSGRVKTKSPPSAASIKSPSSTFMSPQPASKSKPACSGTESGMCSYPMSGPLLRQARNPRVPCVAVMALDDPTRAPCGFIPRPCPCPRLCGVWPLCSYRLSKATKSISSVCSCRPLSNVFGNSRGEWKRRKNAWKWSRASPRFMWQEWPLTVTIGAHTPQRPS